MVDPDKPLRRLTPRMEDCFWLVYENHKSSLVGITYAEIMAGLDLRSSSSVHRLVDGLIDRGYIVERPKHKWRALQLSGAALRIGRKRDREMSDG